jgi:hypothetical protein
VNRVTLKVEDLKGNIWSVDRSEASPL